MTMYGHLTAGDANHHVASLARLGASVRPTPTPLLPVRRSAVRFHVRALDALANLVRPPATTLAHA
jgi:hypothetical protein